MGLKGITINEYIVKEHYNKVTEVLPENVVHRRLKRRWCVAETKRHYFEFVMAVVSSKCRFGNIGAMHPYLVITLQQVKFGEILSTSELV